MPEPQIYPSQMTIFCDKCGNEESNDYMVSEDDSFSTRVGYAQKHLQTKGWSVVNGQDFCPNCT